MGELKKLNLDRTGNFRFAKNVFDSFSEAWDGVGKLSGATNPELTIFANATRDAYRMAAMLMEWLDTHKPVKQTMLAAVIVKAQNSLIEGLLAIEGLQYEEPLYEDIIGSITDQTLSDSAPTTDL